MRWGTVLAGASIVAATAATVHAQQAQKVTAGAEFDVSDTARRWLGNGYRDVWAEPFEAPVLDLSREGGGLEPVRQVGQLQTAGLAFVGADGNSYTFRSLHKEPERILPPEWRNSWPAKVLHDATSATHPAAAVILPRPFDLEGINDSKLLTALQRERSYGRISDAAVAFVSELVMTSFVIPASRPRTASTLARFFEPASSICS